MDSAWLALASGLGGAAITAVAAVFGPIRLQARELEASRQRQHEAAAEQIARERLQAEENRLLQDDQTLLAAFTAQVDNLVELRVHTGACLDFHSWVITDLSLGQSVDYERYSERSQELMGRVRSALSGVDRYGGSRIRSLGRNTGVLRSSSFLRDMESTGRKIAEFVVSSPGTSLSEADAARLRAMLEAASCQREHEINTLRSEVNRRYGTKFDHLRPLR
ncbi:hypothetical protein ACWCWQ_34530 [Streptomyces sp. NPDC001571]